MNNKWNKVDPYNLEYIEKQIKAIKDKQNTPNSGEKTKDDDKIETRKIEDILAEQLIVLQQIQHTLKNIEITASQKGWKNLF